MSIFSKLITLFTKTHRNKKIMDPLATTQKRLQETLAKKTQLGAELSTVEGNIEIINDYLRKCSLSNSLESEIRELWEKINTLKSGPDQMQIAVTHTTAKVNVQRINLHKAQHDLNKAQSTLKTAKARAVQLYTKNTGVVYKNNANDDPVAWLEEDIARLEDRHENNPSDELAKRIQERKNLQTVLTTAAKDVPEYTEEINTAKVALERNERKLARFSDKSPDGSLAATESRYNQLVGIKENLAELNSKVAVLNVKILDVELEESQFIDKIGFIKYASEEKVDQTTNSSNSDFIFLPSLIPARLGQLTKDIQQLENNVVTAEKGNSTAKLIASLNPRSISIKEEFSALWASFPQSDVLPSIFDKIKESIFPNNIQRSKKKLTKLEGRFAQLAGYRIPEILKPKAENKKAGQPTSTMQAIVRESVPQGNSAVHSPGLASTSAVLNKLSTSPTAVSQQSEKLTARALDHTEASEVAIAPHHQPSSFFKATHQTKDSKSPDNFQKNQEVTAVPVAIK